MIYDVYFFYAITSWIAILASGATFVWCCCKYKKFGKIAFVILMMIGGIYDLVQCSNITASAYRNQSKVQEGK